MKANRPKKKLTTKQTVLVVVGALAFSTLAMFLIKSYVAAHEKYEVTNLHLFNRNNKPILVHVRQKVSKTTKSSNESHYFDVLTYDYNTGEKLDSYDINIDKHQSSSAKILGFTQTHIILATPGIVFADPYDESKNLQQEEVYKHIKAASPGFNDKVAYVYNTGDNIGITSTAGDEYLLDLKTFALGDKMNYNKENFIVSLPVNCTVPGDISAYSDRTEIALDSLSYLSLQQESEENKLRKFLYRYTGQEKQGGIEVVIGDSTNVEPVSAVAEKFLPDVFLEARVMGWVNGMLYIVHKNDLGNNPAWSVTAVDIAKKQKAWTTDLVKSGLPLDETNWFNWFWTDDYHGMVFTDWEQHKVLLDAKTGVKKW